MGMNESSVFSVFHPDASDLFTVCSNLDKVCNTNTIATCIYTWLCVLVCV